MLMGNFQYTGCDETGSSVQDDGHFECCKKRQEIVTELSLESSVEWVSVVAQRIREGEKASFPKAPEASWWRIRVNLGGDRVVFLRKVRYILLSLL